MHELWDRLVDRGYEPELTEEQKAELDRRLAEDDSAPDDVLSWEEVKAEAPPRLQAILAAARGRIQAGEAIPNKQFWEPVESEQGTVKPSTKPKKKG